MKIAVSSKYAGEDSPMEPRFSQTPWFILFDTESRVFSILCNLEACQDDTEPATLTLQVLLRENVDAVITGHVEKTVLAKMTEKGIPVYRELCGYVRDTIDKFEKGTLKRIKGADI